MGAIDYFGAANAPRVHVVEGEGGMTPGRVAEAFAFAATAGLKNLTVHIDWNQASIDSNHVTRDDTAPGDYVQWDPIEFSYLHDWNVIIVPDGKDFAQVFAAQKLLETIKNDQPTAIVYRTVKGWKYGIEGRASHGAGHKFCSEGYYAAIKEAEDATGIQFPKFNGDQSANNVEKYYFDTLLTIRKMLESNKASATFLAGKINEANNRLKKLSRAKRSDAPNSEVIYDKKKFSTTSVPDSLALKIGDSTTLRGVLGDVLNFYNKASGGAIFSASADLLGSTSVNNIYKGFAEGFYHSSARPAARALSIGGICEDAIGGIMSGVSAYGKHIGVGSSYAAFIAALQHITMRLHGIGQQARCETFGGDYHPFICICAHTGLKTGEDGPTHADPQALQIVQENFPSEVMITLTPWDPQEIWPLMTASLQARPAVIVPFVTRPNEKILDRAKYNMPPANTAMKGVYALRKADASKKCDGTIVLQESGVTYTFVEEVLPKLDKDGLNINVFYVASAELFDMLPEAEQLQIFPENLRSNAIGITGFTLPTLYRFITSERGRKSSLHPFMKGHYMGSGQAHKVLEEAGLDGETQYKTIKKYFGK
jgi:transketolase